MNATTSSMILSITVFILSIHVGFISWRLYDIREKQLAVNEAQVKLSQKIVELLLQRDHIRESQVNKVKE